MSHITDDTLTTISTSELGTAFGGSSDPGDDYVKTLKADLIRQGKHEHGAVDAARKHHWMHAAGETLRATVDGLKTGEDAGKPLKPYWHLAKDAIGLFGKK